MPLHVYYLPVKRTLRPDGGFVHAPRFPDGADPGNWVATYPADIHDVCIVKCERPLPGVGAAQANKRGEFGRIASAAAMSKVLGHVGHKKFDSAINGDDSTDVT